MSEPVKNFPLGKKEYVADPKTLQITKYLRVLPPYPSNYNFDKHRFPFPNNTFGNLKFGDCVLADRANAQLRLERVEQRRTITITDDDVIRVYKLMTGCKEPGDENDSGLVMLYAMRQWKHTGWHFAENPNKQYKIGAYGEVDPMNQNEIRAAIYYLGGVHFGFSLPLAAQDMTQEGGTWDYKGQSGPEWEPNSWGGHAVYGFAYTTAGITIKTWGMNVNVSNSFIAKYCDEAWAVVDALDSWRTQQTIDVAKLEEALRQISSQVNK